MAKLSVVKSTEHTVKPPRKLGRHGGDLWQSITSEYDITDSASVEMLCLACQSLDRAESLRELIDRDGEIIKTKHGPKEHPALRHEIAARSFVVRTLTKLGLSYEPVKAVGRPNEGFGWKPDAD
jgi:hypothetical protein